MSELENSELTTKTSVFKLPFNWVPWAIALGILLLDQLTKLIVVNTLPLYKQVQVIGNFIVFQHVRNLNFGFSIGDGIPDPFKTILIVVMQSAVVVLLVLGYFKIKDISEFQRNCLAVAVGAGLGNLFDRIIMHKGVPGVVDFISIKTYNLFLFLKMQRWPTFNVADMALVCILIILAVSIIFGKKDKHGKTD